MGLPRTRAAALAASSARGLNVFRTAENQYNAASKMHAGEFEALKEVLGETSAAAGGSGLGADGKDVVACLLSKISTLQVCSRVPWSVADANCTVPGIHVLQGCLSLSFVPAKRVR